MDMNTGLWWKEKWNAFYLATVSEEPPTSKTDDCKENKATPNNSDYDIISDYSYIG